MKELKAKPKVTQAMTRDGLTLENKAPARLRTFPAGRLNRTIPRRLAAQRKSCWNGPTMPMTGTKPRKPQNRPRLPPPRGRPPHTGHPPGFNCPRKNGQTRRCSRISKRRERKPTNWMQPAPLCRKSVFRSREKSTMLSAARRNPPCVLSSRTKARPD